MISSLAFCAVLALTARFGAADVLEYRATGPFAAFDDALNVPGDDYTDITDTVDTDGELINLAMVPTFAGVTFNIFSTAATFFKVFDTGYIDCGATEPMTTVGDRPMADSPMGTGQLDTSTACLIAPWVGAGTGAAGTIYHVSIKLATAAEDQFKHITDRVQMEINQALHQVVTTYVPTHAIVVTWKITEGALNHFQAILTTDGTTTYVLFIYGDMLTTLPTNVQGFISGGAAEFGRICNYLTDPTMLPLAENFLPEADLKDYTNTKCGNPGVYLFRTQDAGDACDAAATQCATSYAEAPPGKPNCNVSTEAVDSCTETVHCARDPAIPDNIKLTAHFKWYQHNYIQALNYMTWLGAGTDAAPDMEQLFVPLAASPPDGTCGKSIAAGPGMQDSLDATISLTEVDTDTRCGMVVDTAAGAIKYAFKIFEYDPAVAADFEPNGKFDRPGDLIFYGICYYEDLPLSIDAGVTFNDFSAPTVMPPRSRSIRYEIVDRLHDTEAQVISVADIGRLYYMRICFDRGTPYTEQGDPFAAYADVCEVSNNANFDDEVVTGNAEDISLKFIDAKCPVAGTPGPVYLNQAFYVQTDGKPSTYAYGAPPAPFCIYTSPQVFNRWHAFSGGAIRDKLFFKCTVKLCTKLDELDGGTEEDKCWDACDTDRRRKRSVDNTTEANQQETIYTSVTLRDPEVTSEKSGETADCTKPIVAISTTVILIAMLALAFVASVFIFLKLMRTMKREKKLSSRKKSPIT